MLEHSNPTLQEVRDSGWLENPDPGRIVTNNQWRNLVYGYELSPKERKEFDYIPEEEFDSHDFVRYRGWTYDINEFERSNVKGWDGQHADSFYSAVLIRFSDDLEQAIMGLYLA